MISVSETASPRSRVKVNPRLGVFTALALCTLLAGCGGGNSGGGSNPPPTTYTLTVASTNPASGVAITYGNSLSNLVANGTTTFTVTKDSGTSLFLQAPTTASNGNTFSSWSGCTSTTTNTCTVTINSDVTVTANYTTPSPTIYTLTVASANPATGVAITSNTPDTNNVSSGNTQFALSYDSGASVILTAPATATGGNTFSSWTGCTSTSALTCTITVSANATVTANYSTPTTPVYTLTVASTNPTTVAAITASPADNNNVTSGTSPFTLSYDAGANVILTAPATAADGNTFSSWTGCTSTSGQACTATNISANATVTANYATVTSPAVYAVNVHSTNPDSGVAITATLDTTGLTGGTTSFTLRYDTGANVAITAPATAPGGNTFSAWTGCTTTSGTSGTICNLTNLSAAATVTAAYASPAPTITVTPTGAVTIGQSQQFVADVENLTNKSVTWSVASSSGSPGTISATGLYQTPYPAPTSITVTATSVADPTVKDSITVTLSAPAPTAGPTLSVDAATITRPINPLIYGMNGYLLDPTTASNTNITVARWGGDDTSRYNYQTNVVNSANDYFFENFSGSNSMLPNGGTGNGTSFNAFLSSANSLGIASIGTAPVIGWVSNATVNACSFTKTAYPDQKQFDPSGNCGNGVTSSGTSLVGNDTIAAITSNKTPPPTAPGIGNATKSWADATWTGGWVNCLLTTGSYCTAAGGKDATIWDLDNEPEYWSAVHRDVHPLPMTYDEITNGGIGTALAIKTEDPAAQTSGPIISGWYQYFYSQQDVNNGYGKGPCYQPWDNPTDRMAHNGVPLIEYYMQQMAAASTTYGKRLLDFVDIHAYFEGNYNGASVGFTTAGDTGEQQARMNSTRVFWDSTYTDPALPQPNYPTDTNYDGTNCSIPLVAPAIIPRMQTWVANDYPGTKTSIDEYNFGGLEAINGAVTQADILGIFGKYGLDMGVFWPAQTYTTQAPGNMAFEIYRNYDGSKSTFGDQELSSTTADQSQLAVYAAKRTTTSMPDDNAITIVVINKAYGPLTSTLSIDNLTTGTTDAKVYQYSNANLTAIVAQPDATITPPSTGTTSTLSATFPAQSITILVIPQ